MLEAESTVQRHLTTARRGRQIFVVNNSSSQLAGCIVWNAHNTVYGWKRSYVISNRWFLGLTRVHAI